MAITTVTLLLIIVFLLLRNYHELEERAKDRNLEQQMLSHASFTLIEFRSLESYFIHCSRISETIKRTHYKLAPLKPYFILLWWNSLSLSHTHTEPLILSLLAYLLVATEEGSDNWVEAWMAIYQWKSAFSLVPLLFKKLKCSWFIMLC